MIPPGPNDDSEPGPDQYRPHGLFGTRLKVSEYRFCLIATLKSTCFSFGLQYTTKA